MNHKQKITRSDVLHAAFMRYGNTDMEHWAEKAFIDGAEWLVQSLVKMTVQDVVHSIANLSEEFKNFNKERRPE